MNPSKIYLSDRDLKDVLLVSRIALECNQVNELRREVLTVLEKTFKADSSNFFLIYGSDQKVSLDHVINRGIEDKFLSLFRQYYYRLDPFYKNVFPPHTTVITTEQIIPLKEWVRSEYYNDFLKLQCIYDEMVIYLKSGMRKVGVVALFRPKKTANFSEGEMAKAELMAPFLAGALEKAIVSEQFMKSEGMINSIPSNLGNKGIIILDENLKIIYQNKEAIKLSVTLSQIEKNSDNSHGELPRKLYLICQEINESVLPKGSIARSQKEHYQVIHVGEEQILFRLHFLPVHEHSTLSLIYLEPDNAPFSFSQSGSKFGLTRRELEVASLLSLGLKNAEISAKLFISENTVENHLKSIYQKLGVKNRTSLIHRLTHINRPTPEGTDGPNGF